MKLQHSPPGPELKSPKRVGRFPGMRVMYVSVYTTSDLSDMADVDAQLPLSTRHAAMHRNPSILPHSQPPERYRKLREL